jgi:uncharacterized membrane protein YfcA
VFGTSEASVRHFHARQTRGNGTTRRNIGRTDSHIAMYVAAVFVIAGGVKGITGMGLPTVGVSLLGLAMPPPAAAALLVLPSLATNVAQCFGWHTRALWRRFGPLWIAILIGCVFTPAPTIGSSAGFARIGLAIILVAYGAWGLAGLSLPRPQRHEWWISPLVGYVTGVMTVATGVFVIPVSPYMQSLKLHKEEMVQALGFTFSICTIGLALRLGMDHVPIAQFGWPALVALCCAFLGMAVGARLRRRWDHKTFSRAVSAIFVLLGALMIAKEI